MSYNIIYKEDNAYEILRSMPITYFKNKNESINQQVLGLWVNYLGGDHVLQKENYFLICKTIPEAELVV